MIAQIKGKFPNFAWWSIAYTLIVIIFVFVAVGSDSTHTYHVAVCTRSSCAAETNTDQTSQMVAFLAVGLTYTTAIVNELVYQSEGAQQAAGAGFILLSMVMV